MKKMNKILLGFGMFLLALLSVYSVSAIGIAYGPSKVSLAPGESGCYEYRVFNDEDVDLDVEVEVSGDLPVVSLSPEIAAVGGNTGPNEGYESFELCLSPPKDSGCKEYSGSVTATQAASGGQGIGTASAFAVSAPLTVGCSPDETQSSGSGSFGFLYPLIGFVLLVIIIVLFVVRFKQDRQEVNLMSQAINRNK